MNCSVCSDPIDKSKGYYLVMGAPCCVICYQAMDKNFDIEHLTHPTQQEPENLLEAFRAYQKRSRASAGRSF